MASGLRRKRGEAFRIHEDVPAPQLPDAQIEDDVAQHVKEQVELTSPNKQDTAVQDAEETADSSTVPQDESTEDNEMHGVEVEVGEEEAGQAEEADDDSSDDDAVDDTVQQDMEKIQTAFPEFRQQFRLIKRIGEGTFSTVYKAEDLQYERYDNSWDWDKENEKWTSPPLKRRTRNSGSRAAAAPAQRRRPKYVAVKKIYVTSSPLRILNELELLHDLRSSPSVCPLITAFRHTDQVVAVLPYFRHQDFREYYRRMTVPDMAIYLRSLFTALGAVHRAHILHRDIKPTNFLYDPETRRGVLVDFGLAEREGSETKPCLCHEDATVRKSRIRSAYMPNMAHNGYPKNDTRPARRANRAGTRGFRAPEVLFKCTEQTTKIDIWSAGVILLTLLSRRFPFFNSADDVEAMIEIATIFGSKRMKIAGQLHGCMFETTIPTVGREGFSLEKIILWSNCRIDNGKTLKPLTDEEKLAVKFLNRCLELDPSARISADEALEHEFLQEKPPNAEVATDEDEMDIL